MIELIIKVSDDDTTLTQKHLLHAEGLFLSHDDTTLSKLVKQAEDAFGPNAKDILIRIKYTW